MKKIIAVVFLLFFAGSFSLFSDAAENNDTAMNKDASGSKTFLMPMFSYTFITLGNIQAHNAIGGITLYRFNPGEGNKFFSASLIYTPQVLIGASHNFPDLYHTAALSLTRKINRHTIDGAFVAITDKPVYGGLRTFMGMAGYSHDLIDGPHFSMDLGGRLVFMDIGMTLDNGTPWLLWPIPSISLSWEYEWITFRFMPGLRMTIAPKFPVSLTFQAGSQKYDASLWYRHFRNGNPAAEILGTGIGIKRDVNNVLIADGGKYGINYDAIYVGFRLLRLLEISGGWTFNGKEGYEKVNWEALFESAGYSDDAMYSGNIGNGLFVSVSLRMTV
jgi:hypothetical protein